MKIQFSKQPCKAPYQEKITQMLELLITTCPKCGGEMDIWTPNDETSCVFCNHKVFEREGTVH